MSFDRDRLDRRSFGDPGEQLVFGRRQVRPADRAYQGLDNLGIEHRPAGGHGADCASQLIFGRHAILEQVGAPGGPLAEQGDGVLGVVELRQDHDPGAGMSLAHEPSGIDPLALESRRHTDVRDDHLRRKLLRACDQLFVVARHGDDIHIAGGLEQRAQALAHDQAVVGQQHADPSHLCKWTC